jgi:hypothetical protein
MRGAQRSTEEEQPMKKHKTHPLATYGVTIPIHYERFFGSPTFLKGEDPDIYWGLLAAKIKDRKPETFDEWISVHEIVVKLWEENRWRRASSDFIQAGMFRAALRQLDLIKEELGPDTFGGEVIGAALQYFYGNGDDDFVETLAVYGITPAGLHAGVIRESMDLIKTSEAMIVRREKDRRKLRKEDDYYRRRKSEGDSGEMSN